MKKPDYGICVIRHRSAVQQLQADQRLCFLQVDIVQFLCNLYPKFQASFFCDCIDLVGNPEDRFSRATVHLSV